MRTAKQTKKPNYKRGLKLPALTYEQFIALRGNIAVHGVLVPISVDSEGLGGRSWRAVTNDAETRCNCVILEIKCEEGHRRFE